MEGKISRFVIDACALIAYLRNEDGAEKFKILLKEKNNHFFIHSVTIGEIYYDSLRCSGKDIAEEIFNDINKLPVSIIWSLDIDFIKLIGKYKTSFKISYADSFVLALAERENATIISTDHHEFDEIDRTGKLNFYWLRE